MKRRRLIRGWGAQETDLKNLAAKGCRASRSAAFFASGHDGGVEAFAEACGEFVDFVRAINLDGLAGGVEDHLAVAAAAEMGLQFGAHFGS